MIEIPCRGRNCSVTQLLGDDSYIYTLGSQFGGMRVSEAMGMHAFGDPGLTAKTGEEDADVAIYEGAAVEHAEDRISPVDAVVGPDIKPVEKHVERLAA